LFVECSLINTVIMFVVVVPKKMSEIK